jgi:Insertion element 4 transposase N-terminal
MIRSNSVLGLRNLMLRIHTGTESVLKPQLKELTSIPTKISPGEALRAIENAIPPQRVDRAIESTQSKQQRNRVLPTHVIVALAIAMNLFPARQGRSNPRVVKKTRAKFPARKRKHRTNTSKLEKRTFSILSSA